ncbi:MAG TPA: Ig-like domain-containing protein [Gemmatimonadaceae bacterium]|nr:Ig-like domain-containing protein [Gemmatimonadaceae bacterium]
MRRLILTAAALCVPLACAGIGSPPGGPPDKLPPELLSVEPDSGAVNVHPDAVVFHFDDVINEGAGDQDNLSKLFLISPRDGPSKVSWHRSTLEVRGQHDFHANTAYTVTMLPGVGDLRGNVRKAGATVVFSTGATIPSTHIDGIIFDWVAGTPAHDAAIEAVARPDTQLVYVAQADSLGHFTLPHLQPGRYTVRGFLDENHDFVIDPHEIWDSAQVVLRDTAQVEILAFRHDTIGPAIAALSAPDSVTLQVGFDQPISPAQSVDTGFFTLQASDSSRVRLSRAVPAPVWQAERAHADSIARADSIAHADSVARADSLAAARDTTRRRDTTRARDTSRVRPPAAPAAPTAAPRSPPGAARAPTDTTRADTTGKAAGPKPSRPSPITAVVLELAQPLTPGRSYRLTVRGIRGLLGDTVTSNRVIDVPKPSPKPAAPPGKTGQPADTARPPADTTGRKPPVRPPADTGGHPQR